VILTDVSVLVAAVRPDHPHHHVAHAPLTDLMGASGTLAWSGQLLSALVRIVTNPKVFAVVPSPPIEAFAAAEAFMAYPQARRVEPGRDHWRIYRDLSLHLGLRGGDLSDAWHAALAIEHGCEWWTLDSDFARFPGLKQRNLITT